MRSRWIGFLSSDGEKPDRNRNAEFDKQHLDRENLLRRGKRDGNPCSPPLDPSVRKSGRRVWKFPQGKIRGVQPEQTRSANLPQ